MNRMMRFRGEPVMVRMRDGREFRGVIGGDPPPGGFFLVSGFGRRFVPFAAVIFVFSFRFRRRIF